MTSGKYAMVQVHAKIALYVHNLVHMKCAVIHRCSWANLHVSANVSSYDAPITFDVSIF